MSDNVTTERQYKVTAKDLKPYTDKASSLLKELEAHLRTFMFSPEKASTIMWLNKDGKEQLTFIFDGQGL